ncbi:HNH endonuclease [Paenibacillus sp. 276b]|nr:HNH endonuclease [Paenibacillus sp. 276b]
MVAGVIAELDGEYEFSPIEWIDYEDVDYLSIVLKPQRYTLLHGYITSVYKYHLEYIVDKHFYDEVIEDLVKVFDTYEFNSDELIDIKKEYEISQLEDPDHRDNNKLVYRLLNYFEKTLLKYVVEDAFTVLYQNKVFLRDFNLKIAELIIKFEQDDYPEVLSSNGVLRRCDYLPEWLKQGVFFRDKGRCQLCGTDLSRLLSNDFEIHYDHIVPLNIGGTNDPTNFQLTCSKCNLIKGARNSNTKNIGSLFWDI